MRMSLRQRECLWITRYHPYVWILKSRGDNSVEECYLHFPNVLSTRTLRNFCPLFANFLMMLYRYLFSSSRIYSSESEL